ncbi:MAG: glycosyltransferase family 4 protein [Candidatus Edwardsbacteria bacterium]
MKIIFGSAQTTFLEGGGRLTQILNTKKYLEKLGHEVKLFQEWESFQKEDYDLFHLFGANLNTYFLGKTMREQGFPLIVSPIFYSRQRPITLRWLYYSGKVIERIRGFYHWYGFISKLGRLAEMNLPNTNKEAELLHQGLGIPKTKITVVPNAVEERFYYATPELFQQKYGMRSFILYVGHIGSGRKNTLRLIQVLKKIDYPSVLIGPIAKSDYADLCLKEAKKSKNILIIPGISTDSPLLESAYAACDVFVLPSFFETPGLAALEAGLAGAKIVVTKYGGTEEYFRQYAEYVKPNSEKSIYQGIIRALNKKKDEKLREHLRENFSWEKIAKATTEVYELVLKNA